MLNQSATDREELAKLLNISDNQLGYVTNVPAGCGLIRCAGNIHTLGYIDNAQFLERSIALDQQLREKKKFLSKRTTDNSFERVLFQTRSIQQQLGSSPPLETFDGTIFTKLVNRVQVSPTTIEFKFMNGMTLSEKRSSL